MYIFIQCLYISVDIYIAYRGRAGVKGGCQRDLAEQMRHNLFSAFRHTIFLEEIRLAKTEYRYPSLVWITAPGHGGVASKVHDHIIRMGLKRNWCLRLCTASCLLFLQWLLMRLTATSQGSSLQTCIRENQRKSLCIFS